MNVYHRLNNEMLWIRNDQTRIESGHSLLYAPMKGVLRIAPKEIEKQEALEALHEKTINLLGIDPSQSSVFPEGSDLNSRLKAILAMTKKMPELKTLFCEGYAVDSSIEGAEEDIKVKKFFSKNGFDVIHSDPKSADRWHNKTWFRRVVSEIYDKQIIPIGMAFGKPSIQKDILPFVRGMFKANADVILKKNGEGGMANLKLLRTQNNYEEEIDCFLKNYKKTSGYCDHWISCEMWTRWSFTGCCSYVIDGKSFPSCSGLVEQILAPGKTAFKGSTSAILLCAEDRKKIKELVFPVIKKMEIDGIRGFAGIDFILSKPDYTKDEYRLPVSDLAFRFVEATTRIGGHNQELKALSLIAEREGVNVDDLIHLKICNKPVKGTKSRQEVESYFCNLLKDVAKPFSMKPLKRGEIFFLLGTNMGAHQPSMFDCLMFFAFKDDETIQKIRLYRQFIDT